MSLQYRTRSMSDDRDWLQRCRLCELLLIDTLDWWCREDDLEFPVVPMVSAVLFLYGPDCKPFRESEYGLRERLLQSPLPPADLFRIAWPNHDASKCDSLVSDLSEVLRRSIDVWTNQPISQLPAETVAERLADIIIAHQYVVFRRRETTRRDGGFYGNG